MLPGCVTSVKSPSGGQKGLKLEKVEVPQEKEGWTGKQDARTELRRQGKGSLGSHPVRHHLTVMGPKFPSKRTFLRDDQD
jgi:hypothetical protein